MVTVVDAIGLVVLVAANSALAAVLTRLFRVRMRTRWGGLAYALGVTPFVLIGVTLVLGQALGPDLGSPLAVFGVAVFLPLTLGVAVDYFWMPAPEEVDLPESV